MVTGIGTSDQKMLVSPGPDVVTNVAHNIYIDAFASGGFPLLFFYLMPIFIVTRIAVRKYMRERQLSRFYIALISTWFTYQLQALISINQIGLSIWGWVLSALIIALERLEKSEEITSQIAKTKYKRGRTTQAHHGFFLTPIRILFGIFLGIVLFSPPILNDTRWAKAYASKNPKLIIQSFDSNYFFPENSQNYIVGARIFEENALHEEALDLTLKAVEFNPRSYESWRILSELKNSSVNQKEIARLKMKQLDPKNRNV